MQARWVFANPDESYLTKVDLLSLVSARNELPSECLGGGLWHRLLSPSSSHQLLLQAQEISLNFHCKCEQFVHFAGGSFFNFNGTAGEMLASSALQLSESVPFIACMCLANPVSTSCHVDPSGGVPNGSPPAQVCGEGRQ